MPTMNEPRKQPDLARITARTSNGAPPSQSVTFGAAWKDLRQGFQQRELWLVLGWQDIKQRYRRSTLGPLWITVATGVMAIALGLLYSMLFQQDLATFLPHVAVGLIIWGFISGCIKEGAEVFIDNEGLIKQLPSALSVHVYRLVWKQFLFLLHNLVIWLALLVIFRPALGWEVLLVIPAMLLILLNGIILGKPGSDIEISFEIGYLIGLIGASLIFLGGFYRQASMIKSKKPPGVL